LPYLTVQDSGAFEVVIAAEVVGSIDGQSVWFQLSHDPEMDNGKGSF
jgi:hypothetical protein